MIGNDGEVKLIDFGLSIERPRGPTKLDKSGSPFYQAPEVFSNKLYGKDIYGKEVDIWSLAVSFYEIFADKKDKENLPVTDSGRYRKLKNGTSDELQDLLKRMLIKDPK